jgi:hypothetical protein
MPIGSLNQTVALIDSAEGLLEARNVKVKDILMTDMSLSKVFFVDKSKKDKLLIKFTIRSSCDKDPNSILTISPNHIMMMIEKIPEVDDEVTSSSDDTRIPTIRPHIFVEAKDMHVGNFIPRWGGTYGEIIKREVTVGRSVQIMTANNILMFDRNIITCHVSPYNFSYYGSKPVKAISGVNHHLVKKPFYCVPKFIYKKLQ